MALEWTRLLEVIPGIFEVVYAFYGSCFCCWREMALLLERFERKDMNEFAFSDVGGCMDRWIDRQMDGWEDCRITFKNDLPR